MKSRSVCGETIDSKQTQIKDRILTKATGRCPETTIMIEGQPVKCLLDSGFEVSTLTESCVKEKNSTPRDVDADAPKSNRLPAQ